MALALTVISTLVGAVAIANWLAPQLSLDGLLAPVARRLSARNPWWLRDVAYFGCAVVGVLWALVLRGGFWLRAFGIALVTPDGREASSSRAAVRAAVAWFWSPLQLALSAAAPVVWPLATLTLLKVFGLALTADHPERGPHDRVAGTFLVPR